MLVESVTSRLSSKQVIIILNLHSLIKNFIKLSTLARERFLSKRKNTKMKPINSRKASLIQGTFKWQRSILETKLIASLQFFLAYRDLKIEQSRVIRVLNSASYRNVGKS